MTIARRHRASAPGVAGLRAAVDARRARRARHRPRSEGGARRARHRVQRSADRRTGRQRPARDARLLSRDLRVSAADRHRGSCARADRASTVDFVDRAGERSRLQPARPAARRSTSRRGCSTGTPWDGAIAWPRCSWPGRSASRRKGRGQRAEGRKRRASRRRRARRSKSGSSTTGRRRG